MGKPSGFRFEVWFISAVLSWAAAPLSSPEVSAAADPQPARLPNIRHEAVNSTMILFKLIGIPPFSPHKNSCYKEPVLYY